MKTVGATYARTHFHKLVEQVIKGEQIRITRRNRPVAMLVPVEPASVPDRHEAIRAMKEFRKGRKLDGLSIRDMIADGRRY